MRVQMPYARRERHEHKCTTGRHEPNDRRPLRYACHERHERHERRERPERHEQQIQNGAAQMLGHMDVVVAVFGATWLHLIYDTTSFFNSSSHRLRMLISVRAHLEAHVRAGVQSASDAQYARECISYLSRWMEVTLQLRTKRRKAKKTQKAVGAESGAADSPRVDLIRKYFSIVIGGYSTNEIIVKEVTPAVLDELAEIIIDSMTAPTFETPSSAKWTKTGPAVDRLFYCCQNNVLAFLAHRGLSKLQFEETVIVDDDDGKVELDKSYAQWRAVEGTRRKQQMALLADVDEKVKFAIFIVSNESSRYVCHVQMFWSRMPHGMRKLGDPTALLTFVYDKRSPVVQGLCHLAAILLGLSTRPDIIWGVRGCSSFEDWCERYPDDLKMLYRACAQHNGQLQKRQRLKLKTKLGIFGLGDSGISEGEAPRRAPNIRIINAGKNWRRRGGKVLETSLGPGWQLSRWRWSQP